MYAYIGETFPFLEFRKSLWLRGVLRFQVETMVRNHIHFKSRLFGSRKRCLLLIVTWKQIVVQPSKTWLTSLHSYIIAWNLLDNICVMSHNMPRGWIALATSLRFWLLPPWVISPYKLETSLKLGILESLQKKCLVKNHPFTRPDFFGRFGMSISTNFDPLGFPDHSPRKKPPSKTPITNLRKQTQNFWTSFEGRSYGGIPKKLSQTEYSARIFVLSLKLTKPTAYFFWGGVSNCPRGWFFVKNM